MKSKSHMNSKAHAHSNPHVKSKLHMKSKWIGKALTTASVLLMFGGYIHLSSHVIDELDHSSEKIYLDTNQIQVKKSGLYISVDGDNHVVPAVFHDAQGYYIKEVHHALCPNDHFAVSVQGDCAEFDCPYYYDHPCTQL